ncbi:MAG TPA: response regulator [Thermoguttaceae bacterium]|nr:response regulator [Thermoguttaceae bacterium]
MARFSRRFTILMADDDREDCLLVEDALKEAHFDCDLRCVRDGEELCEYLYRRGAYAGVADVPRPDLILLDLKMPRKNGREVIAELKADKRFLQIPIVALTTSMAEDDIVGSYAMGVNSYIAKPATFRELVEAMRTIKRYWVDLVKLPPVT